MLNVCLICSAFLIVKVSFVIYYSSFLFLLCVSTILVNKDDHISDGLLLYMRVCNSEFESIACGILAELYKRDQRKSKRLVTRPLKSWNGTSVFKLAEYSDSMVVKTHDCFQAILDDMWRGDLLEDDGLWKVRLRLSLIINSEI